MQTEAPYVLCTCCKEKTYKGCSLFIIVLGLTAIGVAVFLPPAIDSALDSALDAQVLLTADAQAQNSDTYRIWADPTDPDSPAIYYRVFVWNVTNPHDVVYKSAKPNMQEMGPYVYREYKQRFNVTFTTDVVGRHLMSYRVYTYYIYQPDMTDPSLNPDRDMAYSLNMPFQTLVPRGPDVLLQKYMTKIYVDSGAYKKDFYLMFGERQRTVTEILFGYVDTEMAMAAKEYPTYGIPPVYPGVVGNDTSLDAAALDTTGHPYFTVWTGEEDWNRDNMRTLTVWSGQDYLNTTYLPFPYFEIPIWNTGEANRVTGTDGYQFRRNVADGSTLAVFVDELYRVAPVVNEPQNLNGDPFYCHTNTVKGINLLRFTMSPSVVQNCSTNPDSCAYDMYGPAGLSNLTIARSANLFISKPHFMDGAEELITNLTGLTPPVRALHDTYVDVEPLTGIPMNAAKRLQGNIMVRPFITILFGTWMKDVNYTMLPIFWVAEEGTVPDHLANEFVGSVYLAQSLSLYLSWVGFFAGAVFVVIGFVLIWSTPAWFPSAAYDQSINDHAYGNAAHVPGVKGGDATDAEAPVSYTGMDDHTGGGGGGAADGGIPTQVDVQDGDT